MDRTGEILHGIEIIRYRSSIDIDIKFPDGNIIKNVEYGNLKKNSIKNPFAPRIWNVGFIGIGKYNYKDNLTAYRTWEGMIRRCYNSKHQLDCPTYKDCEVHPDWHNFQNFAEWFYLNYKDGFQLDKDLSLIGNKIYGAEFCCFVPQDLNKLLSVKKNTDSKTPLGVYPYKDKFRASVHNGKKRVFLGTFINQEDAFSVYKKAKEEYIKEQAIKYKFYIPEIVYKNLINFIVTP